MGKVIKKQIQGMNWWTKLSCVLVLTLWVSVLSSSGMFLPAEADAATYYVVDDTTTNLGADGTANLPNAQSTTNATSTTTPTFKGTLSTSAGTATSWRPASTSTGTIVMLNAYSPVYASAVDISNISVTMAVRANNTGYGWTMHLYAYNPSGAANNKTLIATSTSESVATAGTTEALTPTYTVNGTGRIPAGYRLMAQIVHTATSASTAERIYYGAAATGTTAISITLTETPVVTDSTPPTAGTVTVNPDIASSFTSATPTITTVFTDAQSAVTSCQYTTNGSTWVAGVVSGAGPYTCTASPTGLSGALTINMRATSSGGLGTATAITRTVDTNVPVDGTLTATPSNLQNSLSWTAATDSGSGITSYILRFATGATPPASCAAGTAVPGSPFSSATLFATHTGLTNGTQYSYRLCATDSIGNTSGGSTASATPQNVPTSITSCNGCHGYKTSFSDGTGRNVPAGQFQGSHNTHVVAQTIVCSTCHVAPATETSADFGHSKGTITMAAPLNGGTYSKISPITISNTFTPGACNGTTCHANVYATTAGVSPTWGNAVAGCDACHSAKPIGATGPATGSHTKHTITVCTDCHLAGTTQTAAPGTQHLDGNIDLALTPGTYPTNITKHASTSYTTTCNSTKCHGQNSPVWGATASSTQCTKCHGQANAAYSNFSAAQIAPGGLGVDTGGFTLDTAPRVGTHQQHLLGSNNVSDKMHCGECHTTHTTVTDGTHLNYTTATITYQNLAKKAAHTPAVTRTSGVINCSNVYCHQGSRPEGTAAGQSGFATRTNPAWNTPALIGGTTIADTCTAKCHNMPPGAGVANDTHAAYSAVTTFSQLGSVCSGCHGEVLNSTVTSYATIFKDKTKHVDGNVNATGCSDCHGWPPTSGAHTTHINNIMTVGGFGSLPGGFVDNQVCGVCHNVSALTKHAGTPGNDGTSRNIYLPTPSVLQASYQYGASPVSYDKAGTTTCSNISCHLGTSTAWGTPTTTSCQSCHGYPPVTTVADVDNKHVAGATPVNHIGTLTAANTKDKFVSVHGGCQICHGTQDDGTGAQQPHANYNVATQHFTGNINMNGPVGTGTGYDATIRGCAAACHASTAPYRMTASAKTLTFGNYGTGGDCLSCHTVSQPSPVAAALNAAVSSRPAIVGNFSLASNHVRSRGTAVTNNDCCVCHMEGDTATGSPNGTYHKNGYIELRDPDTGATIKGVTHSGTTSAPGVYSSTATDARPVRFSRNLASATIEPDTAAIMVNQCLKCHDANGAVSTLARVPGAPTAWKPFNGTVAANGTNQGVLDVNSQFASTNRSFHPVTVRQNNSYASGTKMIAPWNGVVKPGSTGGTATTAIYGPLITCWDCHAPSGATGILTTSGVHGAAIVAPTRVPLRGQVNVTGTTTALNLCKICHVTTSTFPHGSGSALSDTSALMDGGMTYFADRCYFCHTGQSTTSGTQPARPIGAGDAHGYSAKQNGTAFAALSQGYGFVRSNVIYATYVHNARSVGGTTYATATCTGASCRTSMDGVVILPGGVY